MTLGAEDGRVPDRGSTVAIVTTFHPEPGLIDRLEPVMRQVARILVVDNASELGEQAEIRELVADGRLDVIWNEGNLGLASALDLGIEWASERGAAWALLLDQDSRPESGIVAAAAQAIANAGSGRVAAVGAGIVGRDLVSRPLAEDWREERVIITSGSLISIEAWRTLGGFRRDFFVDYVDHEFCLRARASGYRILRSTRPTLQHAIGRPQQHRLLWRTLTVTHHDRFRRYSITRNRVVVWRSYWRREPRYVAADAWGFVKELIKVGLFEADRPTKLGAIVDGIRDGARAPARPR